MGLSRLSLSGGFLYSRSPSLRVRAPGAETTLRASHLPGPLRPQIFGTSTLESSWRSPGRPVGFALCSCWVLQGDSGHVQCGGWWGWRAGLRNDPSHSKQDPRTSGVQAEGVPEAWEPRSHTTTTSAVSSSCNLPASWQLETGKACSSWILPGLVDGVVGRGRQLSELPTGRIRLLVLVQKLWLHVTGREGNGKQVGLCPGKKWAQQERLTWLDMAGEGWCLNLAPPVFQLLNSVLCV